MKNANILIVDDSISYMTMLKNILEEEGHQVFKSLDGANIAKLTLNKSIEVILLDIILPKVSGLQILEMLKTLDETKDIPVIMITALTDAGHVKKALDIGAMDYIKKPSEPIEVIARVESALRLKAKEDLLKQLANQDGLTNLYNHRYFMERLDTLANSMIEPEDSLTFAMMDCDFFKKVNDTYGHLAGDKVLITLAEIFLLHVRKGDILGRYGGEEFSIALRNTSWENSLRICQRIRKAIAAHAFSYQGRNIAVTVSIGLARMEKKSFIDTNELIRRADHALYEAKQNGRNRVEIYM